VTPTATPSTPSRPTTTPTTTPGTPTASPTTTPGPPTTTPVPGTILAQDTFQRANQTYWGTASDGHKWAGEANSQTVFSIVNNAGQVGNGSGLYNAVLGPVATNSEVVVTGTLSSFSNTNLGAVARWTDTNNWYKAYIEGTNLVVQKKVSGAYTTLGSAPFAATGGTAYSLRFRVVGTSLSARVWRAGSAEPTTWMVTATDSAFQSGSSGLRITIQTGVTATFTAFQVTAQ